MAGAKNSSGFSPRSSAGNKPDRFWAAAKLQEVRMVMPDPLTAFREKISDKFLLSATGMLLTPNHFGFAQAGMEDEKAGVSCPS